jgi:hypothetical protein
MAISLTLYYVLFLSKKKNYVLLTTMVHKFGQDKLRLRSREMFQDKLQLVAEAERYSCCSQDIYSSTVYEMVLLASVQLCMNPSIIK